MADYKMAIASGLVWANLIGWGTYALNNCNTNQPPSLSIEGYITADGIARRYRGSHVTNKPVLDSDCLTLLPD